LVCGDNDEASVGDGKSDWWRKIDRRKEDEE
jgi:hypothetical protein